MREGKVGRADLLEWGVHPDAIDRRIASGRLLLERPGIYSLPGAPTGHRARCFVALLAAGAGSLVSHLSSAAEWRMRLPGPPVVDITNARRLQSRDGIRMHQREIDPREVRVIDGLHLTSPAQTLFDLATVLSTPALARAANEAFIKQLVTIEQLHETRARNARRKGAAAYDRLLALLDPQGRRILSPLEVRLSEFLRRRGFPPWEQNAELVIGGEVIRPDVLWRPERVIVEADGRGPHLAPLTFASDRRRDRRARVAGFEPVRVTDVDLESRPDELEADLKALLAAAGVRTARGPASNAG